jgi:hypothetical protein
MKKVLVIASGRSSNEFSDYPYQKNGWTIVVINNAWKICENFDYWIHPKDFCGQRPQKINETQVVVNESMYMSALSNHGGELECMGAGSIALAALYWSLDCLKPNIIGLLGCDMDYTPDQNGDTHFYGKGYDIQKKTRSRGTPDPLFQAHRSKNRKSYPPSEFITYLYSRFLCESKKSNDTRIINLSSSENTMLPYTRIKPSEV